MPIGILVQVDTSPIPAILSEMESRTITLKAVRAGVKKIVPVARSMAPKRLGHLKRAQGYKAAKGKKKKTVSYGVQGVKTKYHKLVKAGRRASASQRRVVPAFYDHLVLGGVRPHSIRKGSQLGRADARPGTQKAATIGQGTGKPHPGHKANPYRRRAYQAVAAEVNKEMLRVMALEIPKMLAKHHAKIRAKLAKAIG